jgi:pimeloyl-ACP methyl ester carboxylesterase
MAHLTETFVFKDLYKIRWVRIGEAANPDIIFTHGTPFNSLIWLPFARALQQDYCIYLWDLAGFGQSHELMYHTENLDVSWALQAELFAALYNHWGFDNINRPHIIAHDIGGHTVLRAHVLHGVRYSSLLLLDSVAITPWGSPFMRSVKSQPEVFMTIPPAMFRGLVREYVQSAAFKTLKEEKMEEFVHPWLARGEEGRRALIRQMAHAELSHTEEIEHRYDEVMARDGGQAKRLKIVWAENDAWVPLDQGKELCRRISPAEFVVVKDAGHLLQVDQPEMVMYEIATWLAKMSM